ncbi:ABC transporter ATP-binding protein [Aquisalimonas lutea]|uniref:ABC transporter ATP-binding protein n=1 Tax=Aquisalimonas lutea TaxID=1327750 RepID=UPI0025B32B32|nr:ABC transporter ATP-binding protein [Aquisalimonas lutea]MDN3518514.1 ABC transporter ATP-binding protein [Aquisalimonas lutea]
MIEAEALSRHYGDLTAVDRISFEVDVGEVVGLLGPNGAGKTTILKMLTGFLEPTSGWIRVDGLEMARQRRAIQQRIGYLPENCPIYPDMTVIDYLDFQATLHGIAAQHRPQAVRSAIERASLKEKALAPVATLSRGYRQRTGVAQAILHHPRLVVLDEPTNGLDPSQIREMRALIRSLAEHAAVVVSTHILQEVQAVCDRVLMIRQGQLALDTKLDELGGTPRLLVTLDANPRDALPVLRNLDGVANVEAIQPDALGHRYVVEASDDAGGLAPALARCVHEAGFALYALEPETRDLETLFADINTKH